MDDVIYSVEALKDDLVQAIYNHAQPIPFDYVVLFFSVLGTIISVAAIGFAVWTPKQIAKDQKNISLFEKRFESYQSMMQVLSFKYELEYLLKNSLKKRFIKECLSLSLDKPKIQKIEIAKVKYDLECYFKKPNCTDIDLAPDINRLAEEYKIFERYYKLKKEDIDLFISDEFAIYLQSDTFAHAIIDRDTRVKYLLKKNYDYFLYAILKEKIEISFNKSDGFNSSVCTLDNIALSVHSGSFLFDNYDAINEFSKKVVYRLAQIGINV